MERNGERLREMERWREIERDGERLKEIERDLPTGKDLNAFLTI